MKKNRHRIISISGFIDIIKAAYHWNNRIDETKQLVWLLIVCLVNIYSVIGLCMLPWWAIQSIVESKYCQMNGDRYWVETIILLRLCPNVCPFEPTLIINKFKEKHWNLNSLEINSKKHLNLTFFFRNKPKNTHLNQFDIN